ncbi:MAG TPA: LPS assembly lipoprotein LptE [Pseudomonadales bacterium]|nr:LPS assembly lipoprotein LptE [Pseudomonadales bacterium]
MIGYLFRTSLLFAILLVVAGCGFHLRGTGGDKISLTSISVTAANANGDMQRMLERTLKESGVELTAKAPYTVHLTSEATTRRPVATTSDVQVAEYGLRLDIGFELTGAAGKTIIPDTTVSAERTYRFDTSSLVGNTEEEKLLYDEMRRDVADQIISRIDASVRTSMDKKP